MYEKYGAPTWSKEVVFYLVQSIIFQQTQEAQQMIKGQDGLLKD